MKAPWVLYILLFAPWLQAQTPPGPELALDVNAQSDAVVARGWPLLIRAEVISADGQPLSLALKSGAWTQALHLSVTGPNGASQNWSMQLVQPASSTLNLSGIDTAEAVWLVAPSDTSSIAAGVYNLAATLDTTATAAAGAWTGSVASTGASVTLQAEPPSLSAEDEASKYLAFAAYARLKGDAQGTGTALDTLIAHQPAMLEAYKEKADLLAASGDYTGALALYEQTISRFLAANPNASEPLTLLTRPVDAMAAKIVAQQQAASGAVTSVAPGSTDSVIAADSIVTAYGAGLATGVAAATDTLPTTLGGTTVTITDSSGASVLAPLFYVSQGQVNYAAPASLALGPATVTVKAGDGSTRTGPVTVADVQPGLFTLNSAGLIAGSIVRATAAGQQVFQDLYTVDSASNVAAVPVDLSKDQVYLILYGTGIRHASTSQVTVSIGGATLPANYTGAQGFYIGLDQVNVLLPPSLAGKGDVPLVVTAAGKPSNTARITIK